MRRGDIYYIANHNTCGAEIAKSRPAVIVSNDTLNATSDVVEVVFLTTQPKREMYTHVELNATGRQSTALCEQINAVSKTRVGDYVGRCSADEMAAIDRALLESLGLAAPAEDREEQEEQDNHNIAVSVSGMAEYTEALIRVEAERDVYKHWVDRILGQVFDT